MAGRLLQTGIQSVMNGTVDLDTDAIKVMLADLNTTDVGVKAITGATNASPIVITSTTHGFANGDTVVIDAVVGNTAANNIWTIQNVTSDTYELSGSTGNGAYTSGGYAVCLGPSAAGGFLDDYSACRVGTDQAIGSKTVTNGAFDGADITYTALTGASVEGAFIYEDTGSENTSTVVAFIDGKHQVICAAAISGGATTMPVEPLEAGLTSGDVVIFSNGQSITLSSNAAEGARTIAINAAGGAVPAGAWASGKVPSSGFPFTPSGSNVQIQWDNGTKKIFAFLGKALS